MKRKILFASLFHYFVKTVDHIEEDIYNECKENKEYKEGELLIWN